LNQRLAVNDPLVDEHLAERAVVGLLLDERALELFLGEDALLDQRLAEAQLLRLARRSRSGRRGGR
jgi:hypothetical protein